MTGCDIHHTAKRRVCDGRSPDFGAMGLVRYRGRTYRYSALAPYIGARVRIVDRHYSIRAYVRVDGVLREITLDEAF